MNSSNRLHISYSGRAELAENSCAKYLFKLMDRKESNLALAADFWSIEDFFKVIDTIGPQIVVLKTHMDLMNYKPRELARGEDQLEILDKDTSLEKLEYLARKYDFLIFEDRKFADIGEIVKRQYEEGIFRIASWAHLVNAHVDPGPGVITGLYEVAKQYIDKGQLRGLILLPYMTSTGNLFTHDKAQKIMDMGKQYPEFVIGWIGAGEPEGLLEHEARETPPGTLILTPGCKLPGVFSANIKHGQVYTDPDNLISRGSDAIIVGSGIYNAKDPAKEAEVYRKAGWEAYKRRIK